MPDQPTDLSRVHQRLDDLFLCNGEVKAAIERIEQRCEPCREEVDTMKILLRGNGQIGLVERIGSVESGRTDTLSVKSAIALIGAIGALAAGIGAAMATLAK